MIGLQWPRAAADCMSNHLADRFERPASAMAPKAPFDDVGPAWLHVFQNQQRGAAGAQDAGGFLNRSFSVGNVVQAPEHQHRVEACRLERQALRNSADEGGGCGEGGEVGATRAQSASSQRRLGSSET